MQNKETIKPFTNEMWSLLLTNALNHLTEEQMAGLCFDLYCRSSKKEIIDEKIGNLKKEWVKTDERLPKNRQEVFITHNYTSSPTRIQCIFLEKYITDKVDWENVFVGLDGGLYHKSGVKAWLPLPDEYKED